MAKPPQQLLLDLEHRPAFEAEDFLPAPCNQAASAWLARYPDWPAPAQLTCHEIVTVTGYAAPGAPAEEREYR